MKLVWAIGERRKTDRCNSKTYVFGHKGSQNGFNNFTIIRVKAVRHLTTLLTISVVFLIIQPKRFYKMEILPCLL